MAAMSGLCQTKAGTFVWISHVVDRSSAIFPGALTGICMGGGAVKFEPAPYGMTALQAATQSVDHSPILLADTLRVPKTQQSRQILS